MPRNPEVAKIIGTNLRDLRTAKGWSQGKLGELANIAQSTIADYENEKHVPDEPNLRKLAKVLDVAIEIITTDGNARRRNRRVFLIVAAFMEDWQIELEFHLLLTLRKRRLSCTILVPHDNYKWDDHLELQADVLADKEDYLGGLAIIPFWGPEKVDEFNNFATRLNKPVVFIDKNPPQPTAEIASNICYVSVDDEVGGKLAARAALELQKDNRNRRALVISGTEKPLRADCFAGALRENNWEVITSRDGAFDRATATAIAYNGLTAAVKIKKPFGVVFCTSDSMTLGCLDAVSQIETWADHERPRIIGYDGIDATKRLAERGKVARIVIQDAREMAYASIKQLMLMHENKPSERFVLIEPYLFPRLD